MARASFYDLKNLIIWLYDSENLTLYDKTKMTELKHATTVQRSTTSENRHMIWQPHGPLKPSKLNGSKDEKNIYIISFEATWKHAWTVAYFFGGVRPCIFRWCVTFQPNNLVHLHHGWSTCLRLGSTGKFLANSWSTGR